MTPAPPGSVLVDTDVFSRVFVSPRRTSPEVQVWQELLAGRPVAIAFQTREETLAGALYAAWGSSRLDALRALLDATPTIRATTHVVETSARLYAGCRGRGHALQQPMHRGDRWVAACAAAYSLPIASADGIFDGLSDLGVTRLEGSPG